MAGPLKETTMPDTTTAWRLIHFERRALADTLDSLGSEHWAAPSLCAGWSVQVAAAHVMAGAEQTTINFARGMVANAFRFDTMIDRDARRLGRLSPKEIVERLRARTTTTNHPPAPVMAMLGEVVVHGEDIRRPLGLRGETAAEATVPCLDTFKDANFPLGSKRRVAGLRLVATDVDWSHGAGPVVSGSGLSLLLAMTGRPAGLDGLTGNGVVDLRARLAVAGP
jgi:uncharacterized protein (TIGR03083 family)